MYTADGYDTFFSKMNGNSDADREVLCVFGLKNSSTPGTETVNITADGEWQPSATSYVYKGKGIVTSLDLNADAGSKATISVEIQGQGAIEKVMNPTT